MTRLIIMSFSILLCVGIVYAKRVFMVPNENPYLKISRASVPETLPSGPNSFVVFQGLIAVLDNSSGSHAISFFNKKGHFVKRIELPAGYYHRLIRDRDDTLFVIADYGVGTRILKMSNRKLEQKTYDVDSYDLAFKALIDDFGLFFEISGLSDLRDLLNEGQRSDAWLKEELKARGHQIKRQRIERLCFSCAPQEVNGPVINSKIYRIKYKNDKGEKPSLFIGEKEIKLNHQAKHAGTNIIQVDSDGTAWIDTSIYVDEHTIESYILKIAPSGALQAVFKLPHNPVNNYDYVKHGVEISDEGEVWVMCGRSKGLVFDVLEALPEKQQMEYFAPHPLAFLKTQRLAPQPKTLISFLSEGSCQSRMDMLMSALRYRYHYQCFSSRAIENDSSCLGRMIPPYLIKMGNESKCLSVSYSWGGFDTVGAFSEKINHMKAGNVNTKIPPLLACTTGVDCSGFVSRVWGLTTKWNTAQIFDRTGFIQIEQMQIGDVFVKPNDHVLLYNSRVGEEISVFESTIDPGKVTTSRHNVKWFGEEGYMPRLAFNGCNS